jgi:hypothetical protein
MNQHSNPDIPDFKIEEFIMDLCLNDPHARHHAEHTLVSAGQKAVPILQETLLTHHNHMARKEAAKILGEIGDPNSISALVHALQDSNYEVRWDTAESLARFKEAAFAPLLKALRSHPESVWLREGAVHIFHQLQASSDFPGPLSGVVHSLKNSEPVAAIPAAVDAALKTLS